MAIITLIERSQIELMQHHTIQYIAATLGRSRISIRHELHRCPEGDYCAIIAQDHADTCRHRCGRHSILTPKLKRMVTEKLNLGWSPEMVGYAVHCAPHDLPLDLSKTSRFSAKANSLITVNVIKKTRPSVAL